MEEEAQPGALAAALPADAVHPVVPVSASHEGQPVRAGGQALVDRAQAVLEERAALRGHARLDVGLLRVRGEGRGFQERRELVEDARVSGRPRVVRRRVRQPQQVVRAAGARAPSARLVPPVLDVALDELVAGRPQQVLAGEVRPGERERHRVLELVAEPERPARLVVPGPRPHPAAQVLVEEPAVHQQVEGVVRGAHLHRVERVVPGPTHGVERSLGRGRGAVTRHELAGRRGVPGLAQQEDDAPRLAGSQREGQLQRRAGVEARAEAAGERLAGEGGRLRERPVAAQERGPVAGGRARGLARVGEGHVPGVLGVVGIARQDGAGLGVELGHDVERLALARRAQDPLVVGDDAQATRGAALVRQDEPRELHGIARVHEHVELLADAVRDPREAGVAGRVPDQEAARPPCDASVPGSGTRLRPSRRRGRTALRPSGR